MRGFSAILPNVESATQQDYSYPFSTVMTACGFRTYLRLMFTQFSPQIFSVSSLTPSVTFRLSQKEMNHVTTTSQLDFEQVSFLHFVTVEVEKLEARPCIHVLDTQNSGVSC